MTTPPTTANGHHFPDRPTPWSPDDDNHVPHIADQYGDLLRYLAPAQRSGMIIRLANGYYEGWRPTRNELADIIAAELGLLTWDRVSDRQSHRQNGEEPTSITPTLRAWYRQQRSRRSTRRRL